MPSADVIFYDTVGMPYTGMTPYEMGLGGSELSVIQVAEGLAARGLMIAVLNNTIDSKCVNGVLYRHHSDQYRSGKTWSCKALVVQRHSRRPYFVKYDRLFYAVHDKSLPADEKAYLMDYVFSEGEENGMLIAVSNWQRDLYPSQWPSIVIPNILPSEIYESQHRREPGKFVYASAASRGLRQTMSMWKAVRCLTNYGELHACWPDYDTANGIERAPHTHLMGSLNLPDLVRMIATAEGLFYVNTDPETFCIVAAMAEAMQVRVHVLGINGLGALPEVLNTNSAYLTTLPREFVGDFFKHAGSMHPIVSAHDYRAETIIPMWLEALGL